MPSYNEEINRQSALPWKDRFYDSEMTRALDEEKWLAAAVRANDICRMTPKPQPDQAPESLTDEQKDAALARIFLDTMFTEDGVYRSHIVQMGHELDNPKGNTYD